MRETMKNSNETRPATASISKGEMVIFGDPQKLLAMVKKSYEEGLDIDLKLRNASDTVNRSPRQVPKRDVATVRDHLNGDGNVAGPGEFSSNGHFGSESRPTKSEDGDMSMEPPHEPQMKDERRHADQAPEENHRQDHRSSAAENAGPTPLTILPERKVSSPSLAGVLPFPSDVLPHTLQRLVKEAAAAIGCPPEFIAVPMLATLGAAIGNSCVLEIKKGWIEGATIYIAVIAEPGEKKSPALTVATGPAYELQNNFHREFKRAMAEYRSKDAPREHGEKESAEEEGLLSPKKPILRRTVIDNTTVEALYSVLEENPRGVLIAQDELSGWVRAMDQYKSNKGNDRQFWLSAWTNRPASVDRKGLKEPQMIPRTFVCVTGSIQPGILRELGGDREDGLLDRFLLSYPDPVSSRYSDHEISEEASEGYQELYERLCDLNMPVDENKAPSPKRVTFSDEAKEVWREKVDSLKDETRIPGFPTHLKGPWSKLEAYLARLSLILAMVRCAEDGADEQVEERDIKAAAALIEYFKSHACRTYAKLQGKKEDPFVTAIEEFLNEIGGGWEGQTSKLYKELKARSVPGLAKGEGAFGRQIRNVANADPRLHLEGGHRGKQAIIRLTLRGISDDVFPAAGAA